MLSCEVRIEALETGPGVWHLNMKVLADKDYTDKLAEQIRSDLRELAGLSPRVQWDQLKLRLQEELQLASRQQAKDRKYRSKQLQHDRRHILQRLTWMQGSPTPNHQKIQSLQQQWQEIERHLDQLWKEQ
ncbi:hypothetical protein EDD11_010448 [Mortierella claussenii]|nr:hypothetical protein EDD11_010448 [Mortierella claussenii]